MEVVDGMQDKVRRVVVGGHWVLVEAIADQLWETVDVSLLASTNSSKGKATGR